MRTWVLGPQMMVENATIALSVCIPRVDCSMHEVDLNRAMKRVNHTHMPMGRINNWWGTAMLGDLMLV